MNPAESVFGSLKAAYRELAEDQKRSLLKHLEKNEREDFDELVVLAGLDRGYRAQAVAERRDTRVRLRIDEALTREGSEELLLFAARGFFHFVRPDFVEALNALVRERHAQSEPLDAESLLASLVSRVGAKKGWPFFAAAVRADLDAFLLADEADGEDEGTSWANDARDLEELCAALQDGIAQVAAAQEVDLEELQATFDEALDLGAALRADLLAAARESGFETEPWQDVAGLKSYAAALATHRAAQDSPPAGPDGAR